METNKVEEDKVENVKVENVNVHELYMEKIFKPYQRTWIDSALGKRRVLVMAARQIGKSFAAAYIAWVLASGYRDEENGGNIPAHNVYILSADRERSKNIIRALNEHIQALEDALGIPLRDTVEGGLERVVLRNGKFIQSLSGDPMSLQGCTGSVIVDELSITKYSPEDIFAQALSVGSSKRFYRVIMFSNAGAEGSFIDRFFNSSELAFVRKRRDFVTHRCTIHDAYPKGIPAHIQELKDSMTDSHWQRFYENRFTTGNSNYLGQGLLDRIKVVESLPPGHQKKILIVDPGFTNNPTAILKASYNGKILTITDSYSLYQCPEDVQVEAIKRLGADCQYIAIDQGTQGYLMSKKLVGFFGTRAEAISVNSRIYKQGVDLLLPMLGEGRIQLLGQESLDSQYRDLIEDLKLLELGDDGNVVVPETKTPVQAFSTLTIADKALESLIKEYTRSLGKPRHCDLGVALLMLLTKLDRLGSFSASKATIFSEYMTVDSSGKYF